MTPTVNHSRSFTLLALLTCTVLLTCAGVLAVPLRAAAEDKIVVGVILPLTGPAAVMGTPIHNGVEMAIEELPEDVRQRLQFVYEDDSNSPRAAVGVFHKLKQLNHADVIISAASNTSKALSPLADNSKTPLIAIASDYEVVAGKNFAVNLWVTPEEEAKLLFPEIRRRGYKKVARVNSIDDCMLAFKSTFDRLNTGEVAIVQDEDFALDTQDFKPYLNKLRGKGEIDAIFVNLFVGRVGLFARQARELGFTAPLFAIEMFEDPSAVEVSNGALVGQWYVQASEGSSEFLKRFAARFPETKTSFGAANGYDAVGLIAAAVKSGAANSEAINTYLKQVKDYQGALGTFSSTGDNRFSLPAVVKVVTKDGFEKLQPSS